MPTSPDRPRQEAPDPPSAPTPHELPRSEAHVGNTFNYPKSAVSRIFISPTGESSYQGLTSTLFDDTPTDQHGHTRADPQMPLEHIRKRLMGEAAYQSKFVTRQTLYLTILHHPGQLESLNLRQGKLDFDGVNPELGMHLLSLHWNRQHHSFLITYRPAFMRDMAKDGPYFSKLLLNAIYFGASKFSNRPEVRSDPDDARTSGWMFRKRIKELLGGALDRSEITTIQALLLMASSLFALGDERSAAWLYAGTAFRMIIDLGMHVDATMLPNMRRLSEEDLEIRRRVFWGAFVVDKIQSLYQGRPASLQDFDTKVSLTFLDYYEELEDWHPFAYSDVQSYPGSPAYSVSTFTELCKLSRILNGILNKVYSERSPNRSAQDLVATLTSLDNQLKDWEENLPSHLRFTSGTSPPPPHVLSVLALYNVFLILLHRPFVAEGHLHIADQSIAISSFTTCTAAAARIIQLLQAYDQAFSIRRAPYLISYATYVAATIWVRVAAQREGGSRAHASLWTCIDIFQKNMETNWGVRRARSVILHLMDRMKVQLREPDTSSGGHEGDPEIHDRSVEQQQRHLTEIPESSSGNGVGGSEAGLTHITPPELEASELDMDMIIQSFIRQDTRSAPSLYGLGHIDNSQFLHSDSVPLGAQGNNVPSTMLPGYEDSYIGSGFDDMLFGFDGSQQDVMLFS